MKSLTALTTLCYFIAIKKKSLTTLTTLFYFTTINIKSLTKLTTLFATIPIKIKSLTGPPTLFYQKFMQNFWLCLLRCLNSLLLKWNLGLSSIGCFTLLQLTLDIALLSLWCSYPSSIFLLRNFSVTIKDVCATVISLSGSSVESYMLYYPKFQRYLGCNSYYSFFRKSNKVKGI